MPMLIDDNKPDYFTEEGTPADEQASQQRPVISFGNDSVAPVSKPRHSRLRRLVGWTIVCALVILAAAFWIRYLNPYATDCHVKGYVTAVEKRGVVFKTYEVDVVSESALTDTTRIYSHNLSFSVADPAIVNHLQRLQGSGKPVNIRYKKYFGTLPWRGASKYVLDQVNTLNL